MLHPSYICLGTLGNRNIVFKVEAYVTIDIEKSISTRVPGQGSTNQRHVREKEEQFADRSSRRGVRIGWPFNVRK